MKFYRMITAQLGEKNISVDKENNLSNRQKDFLKQFQLKRNWFLKSLCLCQFFLSPDLLFFFAYREAIFRNVAEYVGYLY